MSIWADLRPVRYVFIDFDLTRRVLRSAIQPVRAFIVAGKGGWIPLSAQ